MTAFNPSWTMLTYANELNRSALANFYIGLSPPCGNLADGFTIRKTLISPYLKNVNDC